LHLLKTEFNETCLQTGTELLNTDRNVQPRGYLYFQVLSLAFDGITGGAQDKIRDEHHPHAHVMMVWMNVWSVLYLVIGESNILCTLQGKMLTNT